MILEMIETGSQYQRFNSFQERTEHLKINDGVSVWNVDNLQKFKVILDSLRLTKQYEELHKPASYSGTEKKIADLNIEYITKFSRISIAFEDWAAQRRLVIRKLRAARKRLDQQKVVSCVGRFVLSSADVIGTVSALGLQNFEHSWASRMLSTAGTLGMMSIGFSVLELLNTKDILKEVIIEFQKDQELAHRIQAMFRDMNKFDKYVQKMFPYGVDLNMMEFTEKHDSMESFVKKELEKTYKTLDSPNENLQVCLAILLSNVRKDPELLEDENFLYTVKVFSKSSFAEKWWNRRRYPQLYVFSKNPKVLYELKSSLKDNRTSFHRLPWRTVQLLNSFSTAFSVLLNSLVALDALRELKEDSLSKESELLKNMERKLSQEYDKVTEMYDLMNLHYD